VGAARAGAWRLWSDDDDVTRRAGGGSSISSVLRLRVFLITATESVWVRVAGAGSLSRPGSRLHFRLPEGAKERYVSVLRHKEQLYCLDSVCYHAGGPLTAGAGPTLPRTLSLHTPDARAQATSRT